MGQTTSSHQTFLRYLGERREDADLDCGIGVRARGDHQKQLNLNVSLYTLLQILSVTVFEKMPIQQVFSDMDYHSELGMISNQLNLFER